MGRNSVDAMQLPNIQMEPTPLALSRVLAGAAHLARWADKALRRTD